jgi:hypothetical protein
MDAAASVRLLTAEEDRLLKTFKRAFAAFQDSSDEVVAIGYVAESPAETAAARELSAGKGQVAFEQAEITAQQSVTLLGAAGPSAEAVKAELAYPSVGTTWRRKLVWHTEHNQGTSTYRITVMAEGTYEGRPVHRSSGGEKLHLYDKATGNWIANLRAGKELQSASPYIANYAFPLWVGKTWQSSYTYADRERDQTFTDIPWLGRVTAHEDVTVPAGTFTTFKVVGTDGYGVTRRVVWYSPELNIEVKIIFERLPGHPFGTGKFTRELIEYAAK